MSISPFISPSSEISRFNASSFTQRDSLSSQTTTTKENPQQQLEYRQQNSAYTVSIQGGGPSQSNTYININQSQSQLNIQQTTDVTAVKEPSPLLEGAKNILGFIETRIANEKAEGASDEAIDALIQQGLEGFQQGYAEAVELLKGSDALSDTVTNSISELYDQVVAGVDELRQRYLENYTPIEGSEISSEPTASTAPSPTTSVLFSQPQASPIDTSFKSFANQDNSTINALLDSLSNTNTQIDYARQDRFSFELTTADGDTISIQADSLAAFSGDYSVQQEGGNTSGYVNETSVNSSHFSYEVNGDIDEGESIAIGALLDQVVQLADEFYNGDIETAYQAALELGYDSKEITGYALSLKQTETYSIVETYQQLSPSTPSVAPEAFDIFERIGAYAQNVLETLNQSANYKDFNYTQLLEQISEQIDAQVTHESDVTFADTITDITNKLS